MNLLEETKVDIADSGKTVKEIDFIGSRLSDHQCTWEEFTTLSDIYYDNGYGAQEICEDLVVVFTDGSWLERYEYDGAEGWEYKHLPKRSKVGKRIKSLLTYSYMTTFEEVEKGE